MIEKDTLNFLEALQMNNNREWFNEHKDWYTRARVNFETTVAELIQSIATFEPEIGYLDAKKCTFRIYRDVRFSTDKSPYKTHFGAIFRSNPSIKWSGYYFHLDPKELFISAGLYGPEPAQLKKIRNEIYTDYEHFRTILDEKQFKKEFGDLQRDETTLQRVPNGYDKNSPAAEYLKLKSFYVTKPLTEEQVLSKDFVPYASGVYKIMSGFSHFLDETLTEDW